MTAILVSSCAPLLAPMPCAADEMRENAPVVAARDDGPCNDPVPTFSAATTSGMHANPGNFATRLDPGIRSL